MLNNLNDGQNRCIHWKAQLFSSKNAGQPPQVYFLTKSTGVSKAALSC